jgi:hypothetical protein
MHYQTIKRETVTITLPNGKSTEATILTQAAYDPEPYDIGDAEDAEGITQGLESGKYSNMVIRVRATALGLHGEDCLGQVLVSSSDELLEVADVHGMAENAQRDLYTAIETICKALA